MNQVPELTVRGPGRKLLHTVEGWLRQEKENRAARKSKEEAEPAPKRAGPIFPSKHLAFYR